jgi:hypothetical protein
VVSEVVEVVGEEGGGGRVEGGRGHLRGSWVGWGLWGGVVVGGGGENGCLGVWREWLLRVGVYGLGRGGDGGGFAYQDDRVNAVANRGDGVLRRA